MSKKQECKPNPLSHYHPIRYASSKSHFLNEAIQTFSLDSGKDVDIIFSCSQKQLEKSYNYLVSQRIKDIQSSLSSDIYPDYLRKVYRTINKYYFLGKVTQYERGLDFLEIFHNDDYITLRQYISLSYHGSNIFDFSPQLLELFGKTDIKNVLLKDIHLPFPTIYLYFGKQDDKKFDGNINSLITSIVSQKSSTLKNDVCFWLDGVYVSQCPNTSSLRIALTSIKSKTNKYPNNCIDCYEDVIHFILNRSFANITVGEAAELERKRLEEINNKQRIKRQKEDRFSSSDLENFKNQHKLGMDSKFKQIINYINLVVNCLLYLQSYPEEIQEDYPQVAPENLVNRTKYASQSGIIRKTAENP
ncbi:hypothetical protein WA1_10685 [Scytonema hofmannii PCC 7110]|uniref:Uncharacterized protein n=1 Tax=Scytonema hofmannii PCC 7110 TaxID=128403 RepID=A0A139XFP8_9CYAN|nr:hypothetical protein [Scytonema hofmannii]KYC43520.1 hypothetical protein WA1_10685 [Scytonema hofmannii PCC 7110]